MLLLQTIIQHLLKYLYFYLKARYKSWNKEILAGKACVMSETDVLSEAKDDFVKYMPVA